jgi:hypothetical protein
MGATASGRWLRAVGRLSIMIGLVLFSGSCASPKSVELAAQTATTVDAFNVEVSKAFDGAHSCVLTLRNHEEGQWRSLIGAVDLTLQEYAPILTALDQNPRPEYLANVSPATQRTYRERLAVEERLTQLVQRMEERQEGLQKLRAQLNEANALLAKEPASDAEVKSAKERLAAVYRELMKVPLATTASLDPPENYQETLSDTQAMAKAYSTEMGRQSRYYETWQNTFQARLDAFLTKMDDTTKELRTNVEKLKAKKAELEAQEKAFAEAVDRAVQNLATAKEGLLQKGQAASQLARATMDSIRYDVQIAAIVTKTLDVGLRITTGLSVAGLLSQRDSQQVSTLIGTTGEVVGIIRGTTEWESERTSKDSKTVELGSNTHG